MSLEDAAVLAELREVTGNEKLCHGDLVGWAAGRQLRPDETVVFLPRLGMYAAYSKGNR